MILKRKGLLLLTLAGLLVSCTPSDNRVHITVNPEQLQGCWVKSGTQEYWRYRDDSTGVTWDESEDMTEEESNLTFTWEVNRDVLTHIFRGVMDNQAVPKVYTITEITPQSMKWEDDYGITCTLNKTDR